MGRLVELSTAAGTAHANSTTETAIASKDFAANELQVGKCYEWEVFSRATATNSTDTCQIAVRYGTDAAVPANNTSVGASGAIDVANNDVSVVKVRLYIQTAIRHVLTVYMSDIDAEGVTSVEQYSEIFVATADTAYSLDVVATWSVADAGNSIQAECAALWELN